MKNALALLAVLFITSAVHAQSSTETTLYKTVAALDQKLFHAYNTCDLKTLDVMVADDLEFYHDQTGLAVGKQPFLEAIRNNICGKVTRELVSASLEVHPLKTYGAVEIGVHRFLHPNDPTNPPGEGKFVMLWQQKGDVWKLTRVISYDHGQAK
ncbi:nuclear transport factor 2 family protein [Terriglobus tenax]|uniref:nuclear transport factor 2 family protein n=1 Tax=Terriglobus tenax TaxID=1111115 RepID=UPI0021E00D80|nr:nuclear transport factor 2 family protein [Terriglobus tenax]